MAQRKTSTSNRSSRSGSSSKKPASSSRAAKQPSRRAEPIVEKEPLYSVIWSYSWGKALYLLLAILVLIGLDLLIDAINHDSSLSNLIKPTDKIKKLLASKGDLKDPSEQS